MPESRKPEIKPPSDGAACQKSGCFNFIKVTGFASGPSGSYAAKPAI